MNKGLSVHWLISRLLLVAVLLVVVACGGSATEADTGPFSVYHVRTGTGTVQLSVDGTALDSSPLSFTSSINVSDFVGTRTLQFDTIATPSSTVATSNVDLSTTSYSLVFLTPSGVRTETLQTYPIPNDCSIRYVPVHTATYDVYLTAGDSNLSTALSSKTNVNNSSASLEWTLSPGTYRIIVTNPGTSTVIADSGSIIAAAGSVKNNVLALNNGFVTLIKYSTQVSN